MDKMASAGRDVVLFCEVLCAVILTFLPGAAAFDGGDAAALILGLFLGILGICACLGWYARRRGAV